MNTLFEIRVDTPDGRQTHWHLSRDVQDLSRLLADSIEVDRGDKLTIREADRDSMLQCVESGAIDAVLSTSSPDVALQLLMAYLWQYSTRQYARHYNAPAFHLFYTEPRYAPPRSIHNAGRLVGRN